MELDTWPVSSSCLKAKQTTMKVHDIMPMRQLVQVLMSKRRPMRGYSSVPAAQLLMSESRRAGLCLLPFSAEGGGGALQCMLHARRSRAIEASQRHACACKLGAVAGYAACMSSRIRRGRTPVEIIHELPVGAAVAGGGPVEALPRQESAQRKCKRVADCKQLAKDIVEPRRLEDVPPAHARCIGRMSMGGSQIGQQAC